MEELADRIEVQDVMLRYAATVDEKDYEGYKALFTENVKVVGFGSEEINGIDNISSFPPVENVKIVDKFTMEKLN